MSADDDLLDGCEIVGPDSRLRPWPDEDLDALALFADVDPHDRRAVRHRRREWEELFR